MTFLPNVFAQSMSQIINLLFNIDFIFFFINVIFFQDKARW